MSQTESEAPILTTVPLADLRQAYPTSDLLSRPILNHLNEKVGFVEDLLMQDDHLAYAIVSVGEFLGTPGRRVVVAFQDLAIVDKEFMIPGGTREAVATLTTYDKGFVSVDGMLLPRPRLHAKNSGHLVATAAGEPIPGVLADISDGDR